MLQEQGINPDIQVTVTKSNIERCSEICDEFAGMNIKFTPALPMGRGWQLQSEFINDDQFLRLSRHVAQRNYPDGGASSVNDGAMSIAITPFMPGEKNLRCGAGFSNLSVAESGDVYPCHLFQYDRYKLGNIFEERFEDIFFGQHIQDFIDTMDIDNNNPVCRKCDVRFLCGDGCKGNALARSGDHHGADIYCKYIKDNIVDQLVQACVEQQLPADP